MTLPIKLRSNEPGKFRCQQTLTLTNKIDSTVSLQSLSKSIRLILTSTTNKDQ